MIKRPPATQSHWRWATTVLSAIVFAVVLAKARRGGAVVPEYLNGQVLIGCLVAGILYFCAHLMRAFRLAVIAMPLLGASYRTTVLLHLFVAPWSLILPFKLDEIVRYCELASLGKSYPRAVIVLLIDRSMDGAILVALSMLLLASGRTSVAGPVAFIGVGLLLAVIAIFVLPVLLEQIQRHVFTNHYNDRALKILEFVSMARGALVVSREAIIGNVTFLVLATVGIWSLELSAVASLLVAIDPTSVSLLEVVETMFRRADGSWRVLLAGTEPRSDIALLTFAFFCALLLAWVWVPIPYLRRRLDEPRRPRLPVTGGAIQSMSQV